ncbi:MAG: hypothetical protein J2P17_29070 [Mycobacterium sp.]|nr:hypothetical protein [Mycobacterium sp.]
MPSLPDVLGSWRGFYSLVGEGSATMVALLFVAASIASERFRNSRSPAIRMFLSASVVHFCGLLAISLVVLAPIVDWLVAGGLVVACGLFGLGYYGLAWRDAVRDGLARRIDLEDRVWYAVLPSVGYLLETAAGVMLVCAADAGVIVLAVSTGLLLAVGIHNAWDITIWSITRPRE